MGLRASFLAKVMCPYALLMGAASVLLSKGNVYLCCAHGLHHNGSALSQDWKDTPSQDFLLLHPFWLDKFDFFTEIVI